MAQTVQVVVIDLPVKRAVREVVAAKIVFAVRTVVRGEGVETLHACKQKASLSASLRPVVPLVMTTRPDKALLEGVPQ